MGGSFKVYASVMMCYFQCVPILLSFGFFVSNHAPVLQHFLQKKEELKLTIACLNIWMWKQHKNAHARMQQYKLWPSTRAEQVLFLGERSLHQKGGQGTLPFSRQVSIPMLLGVGAAGGD